jgi:non-ribosomal peptide synthetase component F
MLGKYSGQRRFAIGSSLAGRTLPGTESLLGFLVNNLVIRIDNDPGQTIEEHLRSVQESDLASYAHGEYPFQLVAQSLGRHPDLSRNPVYQATFTYQNYQESPKNVAGLSFSEVSFPVLSTHVDLDIVAWPTEEGVVCCMLYATALFLHETAQAFGDAMVALARYVAAAPDALLADILRLDVLPNLSRRPPSVLAGEAASYPFRSPWERLMDHVERTPDAPALIVGGEGPERDVSVSFSRLAAMSSRLAETLDGHGVGPGKTTVILAYTGVELFVAMFAVWHRNGSWLLVDPDIPAGAWRPSWPRWRRTAFSPCPGYPAWAGRKM